MNEKNTKHLMERFSRFFEHKDDLGRSLMGFGFACGDGWFSLVEGLLEFAEHKAKRWSEVVEIRKRLEAEGRFVEKQHGWITEYFQRYPTDPFENFEVVQVKEKFGGLRFYCFGGNDEFRGAVDFAEQLSFRICEECGSLGDLMVRDGWYKTMCEDCSFPELKLTGGWNKVGTK